MNHPHIFDDECISGEMDEKIKAFKYFRNERHLPDLLY